MVDRYSKTRWEEYGYRVRAEQEPTDYRPFYVGKKRKEYGVFDPSQVEPIDGPAAAKRRDVFLLNYLAEKLRITATQWIVANPDATEDDIAIAAYDFTVEIEHIDVFGNSLHTDAAQGNFLHDVFIMHTSYVQRISRSEDTALAEYAARHDLNVYRRDDRPAELRTYDEWRAAGYWVRNKNNYSAAILEYDGGVMPLYPMADCTEAYGEDAEKRREIFRAVLSRKVRDNGHQTPGGDRKT